MQHASGLAGGAVGYVEAWRGAGCGQKRERCPKASFLQSETALASLMTDSVLSDAGQGQDPRLLSRFLPVPDAVPGDRDSPRAYSGIIPERKILPMGKHYSRLRGHAKNGSRHLLAQVWAMVTELKCKMLTISVVLCCL